MLKKFYDIKNEKKEEFKGDPQCYKTANIVFKKMSEHKNVYTKSVHDKLVLKKSMTHLYNLVSSITVIELNINSNEKKSKLNAKTRRDYDIKNSFWVPRIFNHAFNILITKKRVYIAQSWFKVMGYKVIYDLTHSQFISWLDKFRTAVSNYNHKPVALFNLFKYPSHKIKQMEPLFKYIKKSKGVNIKFLSSHSCRSKSC
jgi:hypothetical protein